MLEHLEQTPVFDESMGGALLDAARINVMAAMQAFPPQIVLNGTAEEPTLADCLSQAMEWLNHARALTLEGKPTPTSIHLVGT